MLVLPSKTLRTRAICSALFVATAIFAAATGGAQAQDCSNEAAMRSTKAGVAVELSFRNASSERRRLYWLDATGDRKFYAVIEPGNVLRQATHDGHAWVVTDEAEKCLSVVTASATPATVDVGGTAAVQAPPPGVQQAIAPVTPPAGAQQATAPVAVVQAPVAAPVDVQAAPAQTATAPSAAPALPQISPIEQFRLSGLFRLASGVDETVVLNSQASGNIEIVRAKADWTSGQWTFEPVPGTPFVRIRNSWKKTYLADIDRQLRSASLPADADETHWTFEPVDGTAFIQFRNRESDRFLLAVNGAPALVSDFRQDQDKNSQWLVNSVSSSAAAPAPRIPAPAYAAYDAARGGCREMGGYWTGSSCRAPSMARPLACPPGWAWSADVGECQWDGGGACPPWQMGAGGACMSDLVCNGGNVRLSRRGNPVCDCPPGFATWGNYPNLSCVPSVARVTPYLVPSAIIDGRAPVGGFGPGRVPVGQVYGNKTFGEICPPGRQCVKRPDRPAPVTLTTTGTKPNEACPPGGQCAPRPTTATPGTPTTTVTTTTTTPATTTTPVAGAVPTTATPMVLTTTEGPQTRPPPPDAPAPMPAPGNPLVTTNPATGVTIARPNTNPRACAAGERVTDCLCPNAMTINNGVCTANAAVTTNPTTGITIARPNTNPRACAAGERVTDCLCPNGMTIDKGVCTTAAAVTTNPTTGVTIARPNTNPRACAAGERVTDCLCPNGMTINNGVCTANAAVTTNPATGVTIARPNTNPRACAAGEKVNTGCLCPNGMTIVGGVCSATTVARPTTNTRACAVGEKVTDCLCRNPMVILNNVCSPNAIVDFGRRPCAAGEKVTACLCGNGMTNNNGVCTAAVTTPKPPSGVSVGARPTTPTPATGTPATPGQPDKANADAAAAAKAKAAADAKARQDAAANQQAQQQAAAAKAAAEAKARQDAAAKAAAAANQQAQHQAAAAKAAAEAKARQDAAAKAAAAANQQRLQQAAAAKAAADAAAKAAQIQSATPKPPCPPPTKRLADGRCQ